jgi:opacity protein-like surface antigen
MRSVSRALPAALLACSLLASPARAQLPWDGSGRPHLISFGLGAGASVPVSDAQDAFKTGWNGLAYLRFQPPGLPLSLDLSGSFQHFSLKGATFSRGATITRSPRGRVAAGPLDGSAATAGTGRLVGGLADLRVDLVHGPLTPYVMFGVGAYNVRTERNDLAGTASSATRFGINGGAGLRARLGPLSAFVQGRLDNVYTERGPVESRNIQVVPITAGLEY